MIIEFEINGARVIVSGENLTVNVTQDGVASAPLNSTAAKPVKSTGTLREYLRVAQMTQAEFAEQIGIHPVTCNRLITGNRRPSWDLVQRIMDATGGVVTASSWLPNADDHCPTGEQIKDYRLSVALNQSQFADLVGVTQATVSRWESGAEKPRGSAAVLLFKMMNGETVQ